MASDSSDSKIIELYNSGLSSRKIAERVGISNTQINRILKRNSVIKRSVRTDKDTEEKIVQDYLSGESSEAIANKFGLNSSTVCRIIKRSGNKIRPPEENKRKYEICSDFFKEINSEEKAYFLGFLYADGTIHSKRGVISLVLHKKDINILRKFSEFIYSKDMVKVDDYASITVYSSEMKKDLQTHGCTPKKSFNLSLPDLKEDLHPHFLRGVFDGDGCYYHSKNKSTISLIGSKNFLDQIKTFLFKEIGIVGSFSKSKKSEKIYNIYYSRKRHLKKLIGFLYKDATVFLERKKDKAMSIIGDIEETKPVYYGTKNIISYNSKKLTAAYILSMQNSEKKQAADYVFDYFRSHGFPFPKYSDLDLNNEFKKLTQYTIDGDCPKSLVGQKITHHFCEHFFRVKSSSQPSLFDAFHDDERLRNTINNRMGISYKETFSITGNMIRQGLRNSFNAFGVSFFKPIIARFIYEKYAPEGANVLDISAGFGQRMLGACAAKNVNSYTGLDPWVENFEALNDIKDFFDFHNVTLVNTGSEKFNKPQCFDFCFSSPPFFNKEIYSNENTQAYFERTFEQFISDWWVPTANNVYNSLKKGSLFVLNMDEKMAEVMIESVSGIFVLKDQYFLTYSRSHKKKDAKEIFYILQVK